ncbi:MAG: putative DNA-binding domain-containing protein [Pseudomonadota bacterium]
MVSLKNFQEQFTQHLRNPDQVAAPAGLEDAGLEVYVNAIYANPDRLMRDNFPQLHDVLDDGVWKQLVRAYIVEHAAVAPAFIDVPGDFVRFIEREVQQRRLPIFAGELAHFEWLETLVAGDERRVSLSGIDRNGDLTNGELVINPILKLVEYRFPVHVIGADYQPNEPPRAPTLIAAFRRLDSEYGFMDVNSPTAVLLEALITQEQDFDQLLVRMTSELSNSSTEQLRAPMLEILERLRQSELVLGVRA